MVQYLPNHRHRRDTYRTYHHQNDEQLQAYDNLQYRIQKFMCFDGSRIFFCCGIQYIAPIKSHFLYNRTTEKRLANSLICYTPADITNRQIRTISNMWFGINRDNLVANNSERLASIENSRGRISDSIFK